MFLYTVAHTGMKRRMLLCVSTDFTAAFCLLQNKAIFYNQSLFFITRQSTIWNLLHKQKDNILKQDEQLKRKTDLDANLHILKSQKAAAAALAEAQAWEKSDQESEHPKQPQLGNMQQINPTEQVQEYVWQQSVLNNDLQTPQLGSHCHQGNSKSLQRTKYLSAQYDQQPRVHSFASHLCFEPKESLATGVMVNNHQIMMDFAIISPRFGHPYT